ncbi:MAG: DUF5666 domain-containing protein [Clostridia bacterium]|nr:DUF5666 domain-containing protein [Clostridia bacterium]
MITIRCYRIPREALIIGLMLLVGLVFLFHQYQSAGVTAKPEGELEAVLTGQSTGGLRLNSNLIEGYLVSVGEDSLTITGNGTANNKLPLANLGNIGETVQLKVDAKGKIWKGGQVSLKDLKPGDVVYAELTQSQDNQMQIKRAWINLGQYSGRVAEAKGDKIRLDSSSEANYFQELGKSGPIKPVLVTAKTEFLDAARKPVTFTDVKLGDNIIVIGTWDTEGVLTATRIVIK